MPELRKDPIIGRWVIISTERGKRPSDFGSGREERENKFCPFCEGHEDKTPPEILAYRRSGSLKNGEGWFLRVVSNKFPALQIEGDIHRRGEGIFDKMNGIGAHEVVIETPDHSKTLADLDDKGVQDVFWAYRDRILDLQKDRRFRYALVFKNEGKAAGASLQHSHSQIIAMPIVPKRVVEELTGARAYFNYKERCIFCDIIDQELEDNVRVIIQDEHFVALAPYAPRFPFETWVLPKKHDSSFEDALEIHIHSLARVMKEILVRINCVLENPPYNFVLHTSPFNKRNNPYYHWHIEIMPKLTKVAGFEWGTGFYINPTPPEEATRFLLETKISALMT